MRVLISVFLTLALGAPVALAIPAAQPGLLVSSPAAGVVRLVAKRAKAKAAPKPAAKAKARKAKRGKPDLGGIHPLVGSGDY
ncbi:MAG: hypothetical protein KDJ25_03000 [Rhodoblastus sp.]|nr:hypothetical protein [Rhodoblastus sp.]